MIGLKISNVFWLLALFTLYSWSALVLAQTDCDRADELFRESTTQADRASEKALLEEAIGLCPKHALAWNNLGTIYENEGQFDDADRAYRRAVEYDPQLAAPLAGLGDVAMVRGRFQEAVNWYERFLDALAGEKQRGDPHGLGSYEEEYRQKHEQAKLRWQIHKDSMEGVVSEDTLTRGLRSIIIVPNKLSKPLGPERLALSILFDYDKADLKPRGREQLAEMARTMLKSEFLGARFVIEGHTDTIGSFDYNLSLSRRRAEQVRTFLVSQGVDSYRLEIKNYGESRPIIPSGSKAEQAINRRVEFLKLEP